MRRTPLPVIMFALMMNGPQALGAESGHFDLEEIAPGVFVHQGRHAGLDDPARGDSANIGFVVGARCVAVIDSGGSLDTGRALQAAIAARTDKPVCFVINTHAHFDHVLGNIVFVADGVQFVGHANLAGVLGANRDYFLARFADELAGAPAPAIVAPTIAVDDTRDLDLGGRSLHLIAHPEAHSAADLTVFDTSTGTLWAGDLLFVERLPVLDGKLAGWQRWMRDAAAMKFARVVPGHGPHAVAWPAGLRPQQHYLDGLADTVRRALAAGEFLEDVTAAAEKASPDGWQLPAVHARNVSRVYRELEWE